MWRDNDPTALYRLFDKDGGLLYVGITVDVEQRMTAHRSEKTWWPDVATKRIEWFPNRPAALRAELVAIGAEQPRHNIAGAPLAAARRALEDDEITVGEASHILPWLVRSGRVVEPLFLVDVSKVREQVAVVVPVEWYRRALEVLNETAVPVEPTGAR